MYPLSAHVGTLKLTFLWKALPRETGSLTDSLTKTKWINTWMQQWTMMAIQIQSLHKLKRAWQAETQKEDSKVLQVSVSIADVVRICFTSSAETKYIRREKANWNNMPYGVTINRIATHKLKKCWSIRIWMRNGHDSKSKTISRKLVNNVSN